MAATGSLSGARLQDSLRSSQRGVASRPVSAPMCGGRPSALPARGGVCCSSAVGSSGRTSSSSATGLEAAQQQTSRRQALVGALASLSLLAAASPADANPFLKSTGAG